MVVSYSDEQDKILLKAIANRKTSKQIEVKLLC